MLTRGIPEHIRSEWRGDDRQGDPWLAGPPWYENALQTDPGATHWAAASYDCKTPITAADLLNDRVVPSFDAHDVKLLRVLTDCGSECVPSSCSLVLRSLRACPPQGEFICVLFAIEPCDLEIIA
jgi:hypothetical protein